MKKYITIVLFIFWAVVTSLLVAGLLFYQSSNKPADSTGSQTDNNANNKLADSTGSQTDNDSILDQAQIVAHNTVNDCWVVISGKVYDVSNYLSAHPGGGEIIIRFCGSDATEAFADKAGKGSTHTLYAQTLLGKYYLGDFNQAYRNILPVSTSSASATINDRVPAVAPSAVSTRKLATTDLTSAELAKHNTTADCWLLISGKIYNITNYLNSHPGGVSAITNYCGTDGTKAFDTKGGKGSHSSFASSLLSNYYLGNLGQTVSQTQTQMQTAPSSPATQQRQGDDDEEEDD